MMTFGFFTLAGSLALGVYGLAHRGLELLVGVVMAVLALVGLWAILHLVGL